VSKSLFPDILVAFILLILTLHRCYSQDVVSGQVRILFYNVENLFDVYDDSLKEDNDFLPDGLMRWNITRYNKKINFLEKTIVAAGEWNTPSIVAFCEVENRKVLEDLIYRTYLSKFYYRIIHEESPDRRGIDVCLIYKNSDVDELYHRYWIPEEINRNDFNSRSVLYAKLKISSDTIHFIVNHWPSRRGGVLAGENYRQQIASMVKRKVDSIIKSDLSGPRIIILGDFNCTPDDQVIKSLISASDTTGNLKNLSECLEPKGLGTYRYAGTWEMVDQVIVSDRLLSCKKGLYTEPGLLKIFEHDFLLKKDPKYPGLTPFSTYKGYKYQGGFSDHLPLVLDLKIR
jgi:predicted extracellular nuclease